jgi:signal transduction histidine kinase
VSDPPKASSFGLMGIRERALMLNGDADIRSRVNWGTVVRVRLPVSHPEHQCADMET